MFGHLRPADVMLTLGDLKTATGVNDISNIKVIIQHIKPIFDAGDDPKEVIGKQVLQQAEKSGINTQFLFPSQGDYLCL
jgi:cAMP phosphodiesterase